MFWSRCSTFIQPTLVGDDLVPGPPLRLRLRRRGDAHEKQMGVPDGARTRCAFGDSHLALPRPTGGGGLCSYACGALTCLIGTGRSITWPRAAARHGRSTGSSLLDNQIRSARLVCPDSLPLDRITASPPARRRWRAPSRLLAYRQHRVRDGCALTCHPRSTGRNRPTRCSSAVGPWAARAIGSLWL
jgi:hypothetical protein